MEKFETVRDGVRRVVARGIAQWRNWTIKEIRLKDSPGNGNFDSLSFRDLNSQVSGSYTIIFWKAHWILFLKLKRTNPCHSGSSEGKPIEFLANGSVLNSFFFSAAHFINDFGSSVCRVSVTRRQIPFRIRFEFESNKSNWKSLARIRDSNREHYFTCLPRKFHSADERTWTQYEFESNVPIKAKSIRIPLRQVNGAAQGGERVTESGSRTVSKFVIECTWRCILFAELISPDLVTEEFPLHATLEST